MAVKIKAVLPGSPAEKRGIRAEDELISINGHEINDVLDYIFYAEDENLHLEYERAGRIKKKKIKKAEDEDFGLEFETYLMDRHRACKNKCIFCFIDQLPKGMRKSLYFKDDDSRLSFLFGNYITLTNLTDAEADRIVKMRISPINVSVHTMRPQLRNEMMGNPLAGESLGYLETFAKAGIDLNTQLVLCPGVNDGPELDYSLEALDRLGSSIKSIAAVPVGLSDHRQNLYDLKAFNSQEAAAVIDSVDRLNNNSQREEKIAFAADEFYLLAEQTMPGPEYYGSYPQLENGVGLWALLKEEFYEALNSEFFSEYELEKDREISLVTGQAAFPLIADLVDESLKKWHNLRVKIYPVKNDFFGHGVNVAGLLTGRDIINQLPAGQLGQELLVPEIILRHAGDILLDDLTLEDLSSRLAVKVRAVEVEGQELLSALLGLKL